MGEEKRMRISFHSTLIDTHCWSALYQILVCVYHFIPFPFETKPLLCVCAEFSFSFLRQQRRRGRMTLAEAPPCSCHARASWYRMYDETLQFGYSRPPSYCGYNTLPCLFLSSSCSSSFPNWGRQNEEKHRKRFSF